MERAKAIREFIAHATAEAEAAGEVIELVHQLRQVVARRGHVMKGSRDVWMNDAIVSLQQVARDLEPEIRYCTHDGELRAGACGRCGEPQ